MERLTDGPAGVAGSSLSRAHWRSNVVTEERQSREGPAALMGARGVWAFRKSDQTPWKSPAPQEALVMV